MTRLVTLSLVGVVLALCFSLVGCGSGAVCPADPPNCRTGAVTASIQGVRELLERAVAEGLRDRFPSLEAVEVLARDRDSGALYGRLVLTWANPTGSIGGITDGKWVVVYVNAYSTANESLFGPSTLITTGQSVAVQIVGGQTVNAAVVLNATSPLFSGQTPAHGSTTYGVTDVTVGAHVADIGGGVPTCNVYVDDILQATQTTLNPSVVVPLTTGTHSAWVEATTTSGGTDVTSWSFQIVNVLEQFAEWPGHVVTFYIPSGALAYNQMALTVATPPSSTTGNINLFFYDDVGNLVVNGQVDLTTGAVSGAEVGWYDSSNVYHVFPGGVWSSNQAQYNKQGDADPTTGSLTLSNVYIDLDGDGSAEYSGTISAPQTDYQPY